MNLSQKAALINFTGLVSVAIARQQCGKDVDWREVVDAQQVLANELEISAPQPDLLNQLHTLKQLAADVKTQADEMRVWQVAAIVATIYEEAQICIEKINATEGQHATRQA